MQNQLYRPISLIGGSGFIGRRLCNLIAEDRSVTVIDKVSTDLDSVSYKPADVTDLASLREAVVSGSIIVNLAAEHRDDVFPRDLYDQVNIDGARNCCEVAKLNNVNTIVFTSSVAIYGFAEPGTDEAGPVSPFNDYGRTKLAAESVFLQWQSEAPEERSLVIIRPTAVFGEGNRGNVYNLMRQIAEKKFIMVGSGDNRKSLAYVENVTAFIESRLEAGSGVHIHNYVDQPDLTMNELVSRIQNELGRTSAIGVRLPYLPVQFAALVLDLVARLTGKTFPISSVRIKKFCADTCFSTNAFSDGFVPPVTLEEGIARTIAAELK
jgi:nucleoside-diphosphate-sugar epimerase